jgi:putative membrane protein
MKRFLLAASALALLGGCNQQGTQAPATATQTATAAVNPSGITPGVDAKAVLADFVPRAAVSDLYEIAAGKVAEARGQSAAVRDFGRMMQADHAKSTAELQAALTASGRPLSLPTTLPADKQALIDALNAAAPAKFDKTYLDQQQRAHQDALTLMKTYAAKGDVPQVKAVAAQVAPVVQAHLDRIAELKKATR